MTSLTSEQLNFEEELFQADIKPYYWVNQSNSLINVTQDLTLTERRLVYSLIALVQPDDHDFKTYIISIKDLADLIGLKGNSFNERVESAIDGLMKKQIVLQTGEGKQSIVDKIQWVQRATYINGSGQVRIKLSDDLAAYLLKLNSYTKYRLMNVLRLTSDYSWRIYELLKEDEWKSRKITFENTQWKSYRILKVEELRRILNIPENKLTSMSNFRARVMDRAKQELNEKTDIYIDYDVHKKAGRRIDSFIIYINENDKNKNYNIDTVANDIQSIFYQLIRNGIRREKAVSIINEYHIEYLEANLLYVLNLGTVDNMAGYLVKAISEGFADYNGPIRKEESEPLHDMFLKKVDHRLKEVTDTDNQYLNDTLNQFTQMLQFNPEYDIKKLKSEREQAIYTVFEIIDSERRKKGHPPLLEDDITHPTVKELFISWQADTQITIS
ncbi:replication initiation protein [Peribacillus loiseleuriae]|uniref:replication initiation protein n=1 Tax=Peribacillus loiseleuriae TaxID=1679170 RepID=UPI003D0882BF